MNVRLFGCRRFSRLLSDRDDRELSAGETRFLERHRTVCDSCRREDEAAESAFGFLREAMFEADDLAPQFDERIIRRVKVNQVRESIGYWSPALLGAALACVALFAILHLIAVPTPVRDARLPGGEARRESRSLPTLELTQPPHLDR